MELRRGYVIFFLRTIFDSKAQEVVFFCTAQCTSSKVLAAKCTNCLFVQERNDVMWIVDWLPGKIEQDFDIVTNMLPGPNTFQFKYQ